MTEITFIKNINFFQHIINTFSLREIKRYETKLKSSFKTVVADCR